MYKLLNSLFEISLTRGWLRNSIFRDSPQTKRSWGAFTPPVGACHCSHAHHLCLPPAWRALFIPKTLSHTARLLYWNVLARTSLATIVPTLWIHRNLTIMIPGKQTVKSSERSRTTARDPVHTFQQAWQLLMPLLQNDGVNGRVVLLL